jgi:hypothetical protein
LLREFKLNRLFIFLLNDRRAVPDRGVHDQLANLEPDQIASPQLAVDRKVEHGQVPHPLIALKVEADGPDLLRFEGPPGADEATLVPQHHRPLMWMRYT